MSISQALADSVAKQLACNRAAQHHICFSALAIQLCLEVPYETNLSVSGNDIPYTITLQSAMPPGITFESTGINTFKFIGTPTEAGNFDVIIMAASGQFSQTKNYTIQVLGITNNPILPQGFAGAPYNINLIGDGGVEPYTFAIVDGNLPAGLTLDTATGLISGTPTELIGQDINFRITDASGAICQKALFIEVICDIMPESLPVAFRSQWYSEFLTNGVAITAWSITAGALPGGLTLNAVTGEIYGSPDAFGVFNFTIRAESGGNFCEKEYVMTVVMGLGPDWEQLTWGAPSFFFENGDGVMTFTPQSASGASFFGSGVAGTPGSEASIIISATFNYDGPANTSALLLDLTAIGGSTNPNCLVRVVTPAFNTVWPLSGGGFVQTFPIPLPDSGGIPYAINISVTVQSVANGDGGCTLIANGKFYTASIP